MECALLDDRCAEVEIHTGWAWRSGVRGGRCQGTRALPVSADAHGLTPSAGRQPENWTDMASVNRSQDTWVCHPVAPLAGQA